ncbi:DUF3857 domain-containing protein [Echinicola rosea]|uniref:DUF3857 domain-containing protein n=1 Tax=Echinicola rosea TaxID=1807691 RepID=A0ABQ1UPC5_9BACT|nr:DUF3857 and transglutaminase domain-containing protein [Echinicola rosea]GGF22916.1 hypothetical protein GCM10011339_08680 [Echinicola rosea]
MNYSTKRHGWAILALAIAILFTSTGFSQEIKLGKYSQEELDMISCSFEPEAPAIVLGEQGVSYFSRSHLVTEIKRRIKVFDSEKAKDQADITIRYYVGEDGDMENISGLKAQVMNYVNGKEETTKLSKSDFYDSDAGNNYKEIRFTFPEVKEGSILEYEYKVYSKSITFIDGWSFQNNIPTAFSRYRIDIPEHLDYRFLGQGENFVLANQSKESRYGENEWVLTNLRSIKPEPYMNNFVDYLDKIEFQLAGYKDFSNNGHYESYLGSWQKLADELFSIDNFKSYFRNNVAKDLQEIEVEGDSDLAKATHIYEYIKEHYGLNDERGFVPSQSAKRLMDGKVGGQTDLNLLFMAMLRAHGIQADPLLISTKGNGRSYLVQFPFVTQFNRLIVQVIIDGEPVYADTSEEHMPFGYLPMNSHVKGGFLVMEKDSGLINVSLNHKSGLQQMVDVSFKGDTLHYDHAVRYLDYDAVDFLEENEGLAVEDVEAWFELEENSQVDDFSLEKSMNETLRVESKFDLYKTFDYSTEMLLVNPIVIARHRENPFKVDERNFPVDFNYLISDNYIATIHVPEGYVLDDYPEKLTISMPGGLAKFMYLPQEDKANKLLLINMKFDINSEIVHASEYQELKTFMEFLVNKLQEPVVLKKAALISEAE